jgi:hypothetical protein
MNHENRLRTTAIVIAATVAAVGLWGLVSARHLGATEPSGVLLGWRAFELGLLTVNPLGAGFTLLAGVAALVAALLRRWGAVAAVAAVLAAMAVQVPVQWNQPSNLLGSRGTNLSFWAGAAIGLLAVSFAARSLRQPTTVTERTASEQKEGSA